MYNEDSIWREKLKFNENIVYSCKISMKLP